MGPNNRVVLIFFQCALVFGLLRAEGIGDKILNKCLVIRIVPESIEKDTIV